MRPILRSRPAKRSGRTARSAVRSGATAPRSTGFTPLAAEPLRAERYVVEPQHVGIVAVALPAELQVRGHRRPVGLAQPLTIDVLRRFALDLQTRHRFAVDPGREAPLLAI